MNESTDTDPQDPSAPDRDEPASTAHPLQRAHKFFLKAAPVIREVNDTIDRHGGIEQVRDKVVARAGEVLKQVDDVVANATAIEGEVVQREPRAPATTDDSEQASRARARTSPLATPVEPRRSPRKWIAIGVVTAAATYGALRLQHRR
ncbi:MAG: hypothetical protein JWL76_2255 [Thermoleophilia bacterium]|nr:hypothetical protein [Thermoleophilia bacterium]